MCSLITCFLYGEPHPPLPREFRYKMLYAAMDIDLMFFLQEALKEEDCFVDYVPDFDTSRLFLTSREIRFDLLLLEQEIAGGHGVELVRLARSLEHRKRTPIIFLSLKGDAARWRSAGADAFLRKPVEDRVLLETIKRLTKIV
ncbi:MAG: response regulator [Pyrinomonadaceae bacterium]